jgi:hypothetical protein
MNNKWIYKNLKQIWNILFQTWNVFPIEKLLIIQNIEWFIYWNSKLLKMWTNESKEYY